MKREINQYLLEWKDRSDRKPLIIRGARQVGKSYTVESFARQCFKPVFLDIGLANHIGNVQLIEIDYLITHNEGMLAEQFVGQEFGVKFIKFVKRF